MALASKIAASLCLLLALACGGSTSEDVSAIGATGAGAGGGGAGGGAGSGSGAGGAAGGAGVGGAAAGGGAGGAGAGGAGGAAGKKAGAGGESAGSAGDGAGSGGAAGKSAGGAAGGGGEAGAGEGGAAGEDPCGPDSCAGLSCGEPCVYKLVEFPPCAGSTMFGYCNEEHHCEGDFLSGQACMGPPCSGKPCGSDCTLAGKQGRCRPVLSSSETVCELGEFYGCPGFDACAGKGCGDACDLCPPGADCAPKPGTCTPENKCLQGLPPGCHDCTTDKECFSYGQRPCQDSGTEFVAVTCSENDCRLIFDTFPPSSHCQPRCSAWDSQGEGDCGGRVLGWKWDGQQCVQVEGCTVKGKDSTLFLKEEHCKENMADCAG